MVIVWMIVLAASLKAAKTDATPLPPVDTKSTAMTGEEKRSRGQGFFVWQNWNAASNSLTLVTMMPMSSTTYLSSSPWPSTTPTQVVEGNDLSRPNFGTKFNSSFIKPVVRQVTEPPKDWNIETSLMELSVNSTVPPRETITTTTLPVGVFMVTKNETRKNGTNTIVPTIFGLTNGCSWVVKHSTPILLAAWAALGLTIK